jgi:hypothetical protein
VPHPDISLLHSITLSVRTKIDSGTVRPSAFAAGTLMTSSNTQAYFTHRTALRRNGALPCHHSQARRWPRWGSRELFLDVAWDFAPQPMTKTLPGVAFTGQKGVQLEVVELY